MDKETTIKAYKGFNKDMTCKGFQYKEGQEYHHDGAVKACNSGFHACEAPVDCFNYYAPGQSVFHEVELGGETSRDTDDTKIAASRIKIGAKINVAGICKAQFEFVRSRCTNEHNAEEGKPATAGSYGAATSRGKSSTGKNGLSVARGNNVRVRGGLGAVLVIAEENRGNYDIKEWKAAVVDGERIKADTWYKLENGEFVECE